MTNTVKCRPTSTDKSTHRVSNRAPTDLEIRCCARFLAGEIKERNPNVVLAMGAIPLKVLTGLEKPSITNYRSVPLEGNKREDGLAPRYKVVASFHPAYVMRQQDLWPAAVYDLVRARVESASPVIKRREWKNIIHASLTTHREALLGDIRRTGAYFHDLETTGLDARSSAIRCIGISGNAETVYVFDWTSDVVEFTKQLHADPTLTCVGQNSEGFDIYYQEGKGIEFGWDRGKRSFDTMIGFHLLNSALPKDLGFIGATYTDEVYWKNETMYKAGEDALQTGCGKDVHATARAYFEELEEMRITQVEGLYWNQIAPLQPILRKMSRRGVKKNFNRAVAWSILLNRKADELEVRLKKGLGDATFDVSSPKQLMDLLYRRMGLPVQYKQTREGYKPTVDADALDALARISNNPILLLVRAIRTLRKYDSTFINCAHDDNHFIHGHFSTAKAANGRLNSFDPNMQNFPLMMREIVTPDSPDHVLIARDWSQIEWRIAMVLAGDKIGLDALAAGRDAHQDAYSNAHGVAYDDVSKAMRFEAKTYNYGLLYGRGADSLAAGRPGHPESAIPVEKVQDYIEKFFGKYTAYKTFRDQIETQVAKQHYVKTAWGRRRYWYTKGRMPEAFNFPISGTAAHMMYEAIIQCDRQLPEGAEVRLTVHDELVLNSVKEYKILKQAIECTRDVMQQPFKEVTEYSLYPQVVKHYYPQGWWCLSDCHIGENWKVTKGENKEDKATEAELRKTLGVDTLRFS